MSTVVVSSSVRNENREPSFNAYQYLIHSPLTSLRSKQPHIGQSPRLLGDIFFTVSGLCLFRDVVGESGYSSSAILVCGFTLNECERLASRPVEPLVKLLHLGAIISRLVHGRLPTVPDLPLFLSPTVKMALKPASEILRYNLDFGGSILYNERHNRYIPTHKLYTRKLYSNT